MLGLLFVQQARGASWITNGPLVTARTSHTTTLLPNGKLLVAGGWNGNYLSSAELFDPATGKSVATGSMATGRCFHTATLLPNGKVLVAGGYGNDASDYLVSAELYDPGTGSWTNGGSMVRGHVYHTATLLANGKVLLSGGVPSMGAAEIFDPISGTWTNTGLMTRGRWYHSATLLADGRVLVAGGDYNYLPPGILPTAEIYNPQTGNWTSTSPMRTNRTSATGILLPNGQVLVAGGWLMAQVQTEPPAYSSFSLTSAELYDPVTGTWTDTTNAMTAARNDHTASLLPNGQVLVVAGFQNGPGDIDSTELFDSGTGAWFPTTNKLSSVRSDHTATLLPSGKVVVIGGFSRDFPTNSVEVYDPTINPTTGTWTISSAMNSARRFHTATLLPNGKVLVAGGANGNAILASAELYDWSTGLWLPTGSMTTNRASHSAILLLNGTVLVTGGVFGGATVHSSAEIYDPATGSWSRTNGMVTTARYSHNSTLLANGKVLVAGGHNNGSIAGAELYEPSNGTWSKTSPLTPTRERYTAILLKNGKVLVVGGDDSSLNPFRDTPVYDLFSGKWSSGGSLNVARGSHTATLLPDGRILAAGGLDADSDYLASAEIYDPVAQSWTLTTAMHSIRGYHTATLLLNGQVLIAGGFGLTNGFRSELFDPATQTWIETDALRIPRDLHTATLLPNGNVLVVGGGDTNFNALSSAELYHPGLGYSNSWQPKISMMTSPINLGSPVVVTGAQFRGLSSASGGNTQDSSSGYPLVQLRNIDSGQSEFLLTSSWSSNSLASVPIWKLPPGYALATVFVNGIPSTSAIVSIKVPIPIPPRLTNASRTLNSAFQFNFTNNVGATFGVLASTNVGLPWSNWTALDGVIEISPGQFQFTDSQATNFTRRYYRIWSL